MNWIGFCLSFPILIHLDTLSKCIKIEQMHASALKYTKRHTCDLKPYKIMHYQSNSINFKIILTDFGASGKQLCWISFTSIKCLVSQLESRKGSTVHTQHNKLWNKIILDLLINRDTRSLFYHII